VPREVHLSVTGMTCGHCRASVEDSLTALPGVSDVNVDLDAATARATVPDEVGVDTLVSAVKAAGYSASEAPLV